MSVSSPRRQRFAGPWRSALVALGLVCILANATPLLSQETASSSAEEGQEAGEPATGEGTFLDEVTVTADHVPSSLRDTPGNVSIVTEEDIEDQLFEDVADLVRYEPGVYVEGDNTRLGLNGFNIRGIGGNRVLTQVDGVPGAEQFDFGPFNVHQQAIDIDTLKSAEIVRSAGSALYGSDAVGGVISLITKNPSDYLAETEVFSALGTSRLGPFTFTNLEVLADDTQDRSRASLEQVVRSGGAVDQWSWRFNAQNVDTTQNVAEHRLTASFGPPIESNRNGDLWFEQKTLGADMNGLVETGTADSFSSAIYFGGSFLIDEFDMLRDRVEHDLSGRPVRTRLVFPSKYFPQTETEETGVYTQAELRWNRVTLIPGVRHDRFVVDADPSDAVYIAAGGLPAASLDEDAVSPKLGAAIELRRTTTLTAQYAAGFRAPPYSSINTGFTNLAGGYQTIANPALEPEISDNFELGLRWSAGGTSWSVNGFQNRYDVPVQFGQVGPRRLGTAGRRPRPGKGRGRRARPGRLRSRRSGRFLRSARRHEAAHRRAQRHG